MSSDGETKRGLFHAMDGGQLPWQDFRENVLHPFRMRITRSTKPDALPITLLQRLQSFQTKLSRYDAKREAWQADLIADRGFSPTSTVFPPNLLAPVHSRAIVQRCILPRMSREGLPLRVPGARCSLYELPSPKPIMVTGFNTESFEDVEKRHFAGVMTVPGTFVDFTTGEVSHSKIISCPFMIFERLQGLSEQDIESAYNQCAIAGAQCLRGLQQLLHKAFGAQTLFETLVTFSCAINNDCAVINYHSVDEDGSYTTTTLCKFDLRQAEHYNTFQAWVEGIESWACLHLLPKIKAAVARVAKSILTPPITPPSATLSIDTTNPEVDPQVMSELRRTWPKVAWRQDTDETPINSSMAQCGTPMPARTSRSLALAPASSSSREPSPPSNLMRLQTDLPGPRIPLDVRRFSARSPYGPFLDTTDTPPDSPCRPPSLSPISPGPEMPNTARSPVLVLQKRLDLASNEIQELRGQVEDLQLQLTNKTQTFEARLDAVLEATMLLARQYERCKTSPSVVQKNGSGNCQDRTYEATGKEHIDVGDCISTANQSGQWRSESNAEDDHDDGGHPDLPGAYPYLDHGTDDRYVPDVGWRSLETVTRILDRDTRQFIVVFMVTAVSCWLISCDVKTGVFHMLLAICADQYD